MARARFFTPTEDRLIRIWDEEGISKAEIARRLGRTRQSIYQRLERMKNTGETAQYMVPIGSSENGK